MEWGWFLFAVFYLIVVLIGWLGALLLLLLHLHNLPDDERRVVASFLKWDSRTQGFISLAATAEAMAKMGILEPCAAPNPKNFKAQRGDSFFTIKRGSSATSRSVLTFSH